jgi:hypothetical protein
MIFLKNVNVEKGNKMQIGVEPKSKDIAIYKIGKIYEISFEKGKAIIWLDREEMIIIRTRITEALKEEIDVDKNIDMFKETDTCIDEIGNVGGFDKDCSRGDEDDGEI